jgi:hypothetical protein
LLGRKQANPAKSSLPPQTTLHRQGAIGRQGTQVAHRIAAHDCDAVGGRVEVDAFATNVLNENALLPSR